MAAMGAHTTAHSTEMSIGGRSMQWWAMATFIASEAIFFATLISSYLFLRFSLPVWPPKGLPHLGSDTLIFNTVMLLASGIPQHMASQAIARGDRKNHQRFTIAAMVLGALFLLGTAWEYTHAGFTPEDGVYGSTFFTVTGFHASHVTVALIFLLITFIRSIRGSFTPEHHFGVEAATMYWHFVDAVWIAIVITIYLL
jgi:cytochrome c oxidase subunit III